MDARDFDKEEFITLRAESQFHQVNASAIFALNVTGIGVGVAATTADRGIALPLVAILTSVLWMRYIDHVVAIFRVAAYITCWLRPRVGRKLDDGDVLMWETFLRSSEQHSERGRRSVALPASPWSLLDRQRASTWHNLVGPGRDARTGTFIASLAFVLPPPVMLIVYVVQATPGANSSAQLIVSIAAPLAGLIWLYAAARVWVTARWIRRIDGKVQWALGLGPPRHETDRCAADESDGA